MKTLIQLLAFTGLIFSFVSKADVGYSMKVFAEKGAEARAQEFIDKLIQLEPFKQLHEQGIFVISSEPILVKTTQCKGGNYGIARLADCNFKEVAKLCKKSQLCPLFTSVPEIGTGGSPYPVASSSFPWTTMLHEVIHTFGFADEYAYTQEETKVYCSSLVQVANEHQEKSVVYYASEEEAKAACLSKISWCEEAILDGATVATKKDKGWVIGSPAPEKCPSDMLGVYLGGGCEKSKPSSTYRPYYCPTIMGFPKIGQDQCEVGERHKILARMPNLLPAYYQLLLFKAMAGEKTQANFKPHFEELPLDFSYGIPEVDKLPAGNSSEGQKCSRD